MTRFSHLSLLTLMTLLLGCPSVAMLPARRLAATEVVLGGSLEAAGPPRAVAHGHVGLGGVADVGAFASLGLDGPAAGVAGRVYVFGAALRLRLAQEVADDTLEGDPPMEASLDQILRRYVGQLGVMTTPQAGAFAPYYGAVLSLGTRPTEGLSFVLDDLGPSVGFSLVAGVQIPLGSRTHAQLEFIASPPLSNGHPELLSAFWSAQMNLGVHVSMTPTPPPIPASATP